MTQTITVSIAPNAEGAALLRRLAASLEGGATLVESIGAAVPEAATPAPKKRGRPAKAKAAEPEEETDDFAEAEEIEEDEGEAEEEIEEEEIEEEPAPKRAVKGASKIKGGITFSLKDDVIPACKANRPKALKLLKKFGIDSVNSLPESKYGEFLKQLRA